MWILFLAVFVLFSQGNSQGFYTVTGPKVVRPNSEYHAAVSIQSTSSPTTVDVVIQGRSYSGKVYKERDVVTVQPYGTRIARLEIGDIEPGEYQLTAKGSGGLDFEDLRRLKFVPKSYSVFVQTDKGVYKPGDLVLFRAIALNSQLKPAAEVRNEPLNIHISDGQGNKVKQWRSVTATRGVFTGELQLSPNPVLGNWNISVTIHGQTFNKTFEVAQYVLPKFLINLQTSRHVTFRDNIISVNIQALYSYGKKVKGDATVTVYPTIFSGVIQPIFQNPVRKVLPIEGALTVNFDIEKELQLSDEYERTVIVDVRIEEALTGRIQNNSVEVQLHKYDYKVEIVKTADYYKPGLKYVAYVKVTNQDGTPLKPDRKTIRIKHGYSRMDEVYAEETREIDLKTGLVKLELYPPRNYTNQTALRIEAEYLDLKERMPPVPAAVSLSNTYLQASLETDHPRINVDVEILVNCTEKMRFINYELLGRGDVLIANSLQVDNSKTFKFHFTATHAMVPVSHLIVSYIRDSGELVADSIDIEVDGLMQNFLDIQLNTVETEPESDIDLTIRSQSNSYIGLQAVDENVGLLRSGFDLTPEDVSKELRRYDSSAGAPYWTVMKDRDSHFFWKQGSSNTNDIFLDSGSLLLTNSIVTNTRPILEDIYLRPVSYEAKTVKPDRGVGLSFPVPTRPPLAGPYAFSRIPKPVWDKPKVYLTQDVADTWLFTNFSSGYEGKTSLRRKIPKTLNTWSISGFSLDPLHGLGVIAAPKRLKVTKPFVVTFDLPPSIKRDEILLVPVVVHNQRDQDILAEVVLHNPEQGFDYADADESNNSSSSKKVELYRRKKLTVKKFSQSSTSFMVTTHRIGNLELKITGSGQSKTDTATKILKVLPEGEQQHFTKTILIDLRKSSVFKGNVTYALPRNVVEDSQIIEASVVGDLLGPTIINLDTLIRLPTGCGEQNLVHFVPNLIVLDHLVNTGQLTQPIQSEAVRNLEVGYQEQLTYRRTDGSFSPFGDRDQAGSTWLTAYTAMAFAQARTYVFVDENIINNALKWLAEHQSANNGSFVETGSVIHANMQNRNGKSLALTAYVVMSLLENRSSTSIHNNAINKGLDYIARNLNEDESAYTVSICSYVLHLANHISKQNAFNLLDSKSKSSANLKWWAEEVPAGEEQKNPWNRLPKSIDIETTSYGLLTFLEAGQLEDALPVLNWLVGQSNSIGGFTSSQDTVLGLMALKKLVAKFGAATDMQIEFSSRKQEVNRFSVNRNTAMIVQKLPLSKDTKEVNVSATGSGLALFRVSYQFNMNVTGPWPMFTLDPQVDKNSNRDHLQLSICTAFVSRNLSDTAMSNMAVMEVNLPSGFTADIDALPSLEVSQNARRVHTKNGDTTVVLYFNNLTTIEYCPTVSAHRTHKVAKLRPVPVVVYDYYDSSRRARVFYKGLKVSPCNICEAEDCMNCVAEPDPQISDGESRESSSFSGRARSSAVFVLICLLSSIPRTISH